MGSRPSGCVFNLPVKHALSFNTRNAKILYSESNLAFLLNIEWFVFYVHSKQCSFPCKEWAIVKGKFAIVQQSGFFNGEI